MKNNISIRAYGTIGGQLWMGVPATMQFHTRFSRNPKDPFTTCIGGVRDLFARLTDCGDFRNTLLIEGTLELSYRSGNRTVSKVYDLRNTKEAADYLCSEEELDEFNYCYE